MWSIQVWFLIFHNMKRRENLARGRPSRQGSFRTEGLSNSHPCAVKGSAEPELKTYLTKTWGWQKNVSSCVINSLEQEGPMRPEMIPRLKCDNETWSRWFWSPFLILRDIIWYLQMSVWAGGSAMRWNRLILPSIQAMKWAKMPLPSALWHRVGNLLNLQGS